MEDYIQNKTATLEGITLTLSQADTTQPKWIGQSEILKQILACWMRRMVIFR